MHRARSRSPLAVVLLAAVLSIAGCTLDDGSEDDPDVGAGEDLVEEEGAPADIALYDLDVDPDTPTFVATVAEPCRDVDPTGVSTLVYPHDEGGWLVLAWDDERDHLEAVTLTSATEPTVVSVSPDDGWRREGDQLVIELVLTDATGEARELEAAVTLDDDLPDCVDRDAEIEDLGGGSSAIVLDGIRIQAVSVCPPASAEDVEYVLTLTTGAQALVGEADGEVVDVEIRGPDGATVLRTGATVTARGDDALEAGTADEDVIVRIDLVAYEDCQAGATS